MWLDAPVDFLIQYWPYAVVAASVVVLVLLWKRVRSVEAEMERMRADLVQVQQLQSRWLLEEMNSTSVVRIKTDESDDLSIVPFKPGGHETMPGGHEKNVRPR